MSISIIVLHKHGLNHHQTGPLKAAGYDTAEAVAELVDAHRGYPLTDSALSRVSGMGPRRLALVCDAVDAWRAARSERTLNDAVFAEFDRRTGRTFQGNPDESGPVQDEDALYDAIGAELDRRMPRALQHLQTRYEAIQAAISVARDAASAEA